MVFIALVVVAVIIGGAVALFNRRQAGAMRAVGPSYDSDADAAAEAHRWVERLAGSISTLDSGEDRPARQALADATERLRAGQGQLATAYTPAQYALVTRTAVEGLYYVRAARTALGLDPGPDLPPLDASVTGVSGGRITVDGQTYTASPQPGTDTPYYYPGGIVAGRTVPGGWYSAPWWKTALVAGAAGVGGILLADVLLGGFHHGPGPGFGHGPMGPGGPGGFGGPGPF